jgi:hypothetical protein
MVSSWFLRFKDSWPDMLNHWAGSLGGPRAFGPQADWSTSCLASEKTFQNQAPAQIFFLVGFLLLLSTHCLLQLPQMQTLREAQESLLQSIDLFMHTWRN